MKYLLSIFCLTGIFVVSCHSISTRSGAEGGLLVHGHRGSRGTHPENTLPAFREAVAAGANALELDMHLSKDDVIFIAHDSVVSGKLCRDANGKKVSVPIPIRSLTAKQLKRYDCGSVKNPLFPEQQQVKGTPMPTLEELLDWVSKNAPQVDLNIETKMDAANPSMNPEPKFFVEKMLELLHKYHLVDRSILQSLDFRTLVEAKKLEPSLRLSALVEFDKNFCELTKKTEAQIASPDFKLVTPEEVARCHAQGIQVLPWTVNTEKDWKLALADGVDGIITDYPRKLKAFLKSIP